MKEAHFLINSLAQDQINILLEGKALPVVLGGEHFDLTPEDVEITRKVHEGWIAMNAGIITVALDTELTEELILEGIARELVNKINTMRREADFAVTDRVKIQLGATDKVKKALASFGKYVSDEVLATEISYGFSEKSTQWDINGEPTAIFIEKV